MNKYEVLVKATDWCGYDSHYDIEAEHPEDAEEKAEEMFIDEWNLLLHEDGMYGEDGEDFDEDGELTDEAGLTSITVTIQ